ncbi:hypothetical protein F7725_012705 [Dissostichus mawsoni]|uniref:Uncharacterized protein n=1 Tax=Dissostichus mawsoni TaxID=36200 RepID=A0A7J5YP75_DISMA|nr:hypothetical protein F7725_012705 [Dissostichus mawsoni]
MNFPSLAERRAPRRGVKPPLPQLGRAPIVTHLSTHHNLLGHSPVTMVTQAASSLIGCPAVQDRPLAMATTKLVLHCHLTVSLKLYL